MTADIIDFPSNTRTDPMDGEEFKTTLAALGYTQASFGEYTDNSRRTMSLWATKGPPRDIVVLLRWMQRTSVDKPTKPAGQQTLNEAKAAIMPAIGHIIGEANLAGWDANLVVAAMMEIAQDYKDAREAMAKFDTVKQAL